MTIYPKQRAERVSLLQSHAESLGISLLQLALAGQMNWRQSYRWAKLEATPSNLAMKGLLALTPEDVGQFHGE